MDNWLVVSLALNIVNFALIGFLLCALDILSDAVKYILKREMEGI